MKSRINFEIAYRILFVLFASFGIYVALVDDSMDGFMGNGTALNFYTLQSNILVVVVEIILMIDAIIRRNTDGIMNEKLMLVKYITSVAISVTFLVFWGMLAPFLGIKYILTLSNLFVHTLTPILMIVDFFAFNKDAKMKKQGIILTVIPQLTYFIFALIRAEVSTSTLTRRFEVSILVY